MTVKLIDLLKKTILLIIFSFPTSLFAEQSITVKNITGQGVESEVVAFISEDNSISGLTDEFGVYSLESQCKFGKRITAIPTNKDYYKGFTRCDPNKKELPISVISKLQIANLANNAEHFTQVGDYGNAAKAYAEIAARTSGISNDASKIARQNALISFIRSISESGVSNSISFDSAQQEFVLTKEFVEKLREYQEANGIPSTGQVDYLTMSTKSSEAIVEIMMKRVDDGDISSSTGAAEISDLTDKTKQRQIVIE